VTAKDSLLLPNKIVGFREEDHLILSAFGCDRPTCYYYKRKRERQDKKMAPIWYDFVFGNAYQQDAAKVEESVRRKYPLLLHESESIVLAFKDRYVLCHIPSRTFSGRLVRPSY
jgi:hypothetical protein